MKLIKIIISVWIVSQSIAFASDEVIDVNFRDLSVKDFIEMISKITHKNILIEGDLKGKINFVTQAPIKKDSLFTLANSILGSKGYTIIDQGDFLRS